MSKAKEFIAEVFDEKRKGAIAVKVPSAQKVYYVLVKPSNGNNTEIKNDIKKKIALLVAYALEHDYEKVAKVDNNVVIQITNVGVSGAQSDLNLFAKFYVIITKVENEEELKQQLDMFFVGVAKNIVEKDWKELEKTFLKSYTTEVLFVVALFIFLVLAARYLFFGESEKQVAPSPAPKPPPTFSQKTKEEAMKYLSAKALNLIAKETRKGKIKYKKIESVSVRPQENGNMEVHYTVKILEKYLYPVENSTQTYCDVYPCWQKEVIFTPKMTAIEYITHPVSFKTNLKKCYGDFLQRGYIPFKVFRDSVIFKKDADDAYGGLIELEELFKACPFSIQNLSINNGKMHVELKI